MKSDWIRIGIQSLKINIALETKFFLSIGLLILLSFLDAIPLNRFKKLLKTNRQEPSRS